MKILVVEDEPRLAELLRRGLSEEGHTVDVCGTGAQAIDQTRTIDYDAMVLDWMLPDQDGLAVVRAVRARGHALPVLFLTARSQLGERVLALRSGADDFLVKPFAFEELLARLAALHRRTAMLSGARAIAVGLARRFERLVSLLPRLFAQPPGTIPREPRSDEIGALHNAMAVTSERLAAANEARERFVAEAAHELRTPLAVLRTSIELALRRDRPAEELKAALEGARGDVESLSVLAGRLLDLERLRQSHTPARMATDVTALVDDLVRRSGDPLVQSTLGPEVMAQVDPGEVEAVRDAAPGGPCVGTRFRIVLPA